MALPGAAMCTLLYAGLGIFALRGAQWARWIVFIFILLTALTCTLFAFINLGGSKPQFEFTPIGAAIALLYFAMAIGIAWPAPNASAASDTRPS
jgi:hypothetical protein